jgi:plasmid stabilization system protein ParE
MKSYTVDWEPAAESDLTAIWLQAFDQAAVTFAQDQIDRRLEHNPIGYGHPLREGLYRIVFVPLTAFYSIDQAKKIVKVSALWYTP